MNMKRLLATAAMTTGFAIGLATVANAQPIGEIGDKAGFDECIKEHPDDNGFAVCCVFYGGSLDEGPNHQACAIGPVTSPDDEAEASGPKTPPKRPVLTRLPELSNVDGFAEQPKKPRDVLSTY